MADDKKMDNLRLYPRRGGIRFFTRAECHVRTPEEAEAVALILAGMFPKPENAMNGLYELLINAIEHGNLGIGYEFKNHLVATGQWDDEIRRRLTLPENEKKKAILQIVKTDETIDIVIADSGQGFDWRPFMEIEPGRATHGAGRGIARANMLGFDHIEYIGCGNQVRATTRVPKDAVVTDESPLAGVGLHRK